LTDGHVCPRSRTRAVLELLGIALIGGLSAIVFLAIFDPRQVTADLDGLVFVLGAAFALGVHQFFLWRRRN